jgi:2-keto-3-deoxy-L-rhamnonate aldolase RhmA
MVNTAEEAKAAVLACRFPPAGIRDALSEGQTDLARYLLMNI